MTARCQHANIVRQHHQMYAVPIAVCLECASHMKGDEIPHLATTPENDKAYRVVLSMYPEPRPNKMNIAPPESFPRGDYE